MTEEEIAESLPANTVIEYWEWVSLPLLLLDIVHDPYQPETP